MSKRSVLDYNGEPIPPNRLWAGRRIKKLEDKALDYSIQDRIRIIERLTESYYTKFGRRMDGDMLYRLSNVMLADDLRKVGRKSKDEDAPYLSDHQLERRKIGKSVPKKSRGREVSLTNAQSIASNGRDYSLPIRRLTNPNM